MSERQHRFIDPAKVEQARVAAGDRNALSGWAARFDLLSDPSRLRLLIAVHAAPGICVTDIAAALGMSSTAVSQALRLPRSLGWVTARREGRLALYALDDLVLHDLLHGLGAAHGPSRS